MAVIAIFGPTAVGKTGVAIELAELLRGRGEDPVAVSCDSIQVYRGLEQLSGAPSATERERLEHRLVGFVDPAEEFSAGRFAALHEELDADVAARIHRNDRKRIARALELQRSGLDPPERGTELWTARLRHPTALVGIVVGAGELAERIDRRVDAMLAAGAGAQARAAVATGASRTARAALGFEQAIAGDAAAIKAAHRRYGRRQMTWLRRMKGLEVIERDGLDDATVAVRLAAACGRG